MKSSRFNQAFRKNASKLHKKVGYILQNSPLFSGYKVYQEYPVDKINPDWKDGRAKFDWVILDLKLVIECHGEQHIRPITFGDMTYEAAQEAFVAQKRQDNDKMEAAIAAGFTYIAIYPHEAKDVTDEWLMKRRQSVLIDDIIDLASEVELHKRGAKPPDLDEFKERQKARAKAYRKEQYQRAKAFKEQLKDG